MPYVLMYLKLLYMCISSWFLTMTRCDSFALSPEPMQIVEPLGFNVRHAMQFTFCSSVDISAQVQ